MTRYFSKDLGPQGGGTSYDAYPDEGPHTKPLASLFVDTSPEHTYTHVLPISPSLTRTLGRRSPTTLPIHNPSTIRKLQGHRANHVGEVPIHESGLVEDEYSTDILRPARENEQLQMFLHIPEGNHHVTELYSRDTSGAKISAMTLLGMADMDARRRTGKALKPSMNLSSHSMRIVRHLADAGVLDLDDEYNEDLDPEYDNGIGFADSSERLDQLPTLQDQINRNVEVTHMARPARRHISELLRSRGNPKVTPRPSVLNEDQLKLPGFD